MLVSELCQVTILLVNNATLNSVFREWIWDEQ